LFAVFAPLRRLVALTMVLAILGFGWLTPYLASWSAE